MLKTKNHPYQHNNTTYQGFYALPEKTSTKLPAILICHDWSGRNPFAEKKAEQLAGLGYLAFALDMFGDGKLGKTKEEKSALIQPLLQHRDQLLQRINAAYKTMLALPECDNNKTAAIGFCFGGLCALDLARSGANIKGIISTHGLLNRPENTPIKPITAKILALHGFDDPMVPLPALLEFTHEMQTAKANWEIDIYGNTMHAFTNPEAHDPNFGTVYQAQAATRAQDRTQSFLKELFT